MVVRMFAILTIAGIARAQNALSQAKTGYVQHQQFLGSFGSAFIHDRFVGQISSNDQIGGDPKKTPPIFFPLFFVSLGRG